MKKNRRMLITPRGYANKKRTSTLRFDPERKVLLFNITITNINGIIEKHRIPS